MKKRYSKYIYIAAVLALGIAFVAIFAGPAILKAYVTTGIGDCARIPIFCRVPEKEIVEPAIDSGYISELLPYVFPSRELPYFFPGMEIYVPKGFAVIRGNITKVYYKRRKFDAETPTIYLLYQKPGFFAGLFPRLRKQGIKNNYEFVSRTMYAHLGDVGNITDTFFVIMKSIFTPNLGEAQELKIVKFAVSGKRGFITYNLTSAGNYFDCDVINGGDAFFKVYIKDREKTLDLDKVLAVIATLKVTK